MDEFKDAIKELTSDYGVEVNDLTVSLAIEKFIDIRKYPIWWDDERILIDLRKNISKIAMAAIEIDARTGVEGQSSDKEGDITRTYVSGINAYKDVIGFAIV